MAQETTDQILNFVVTQLETNCYAYVSDGAVMVVDPGGSGAEVAAQLTDYDIQLVVATHGHGDHVGGVAAVMREAAGATFAIHAADADLATHAGSPSTQGRTYDEDAPAAGRILKDGDILTVGTARFRVIETPGHTPGCVILLGEGTAEGVAFVGDTLFAGSCGRTDLPGGDPAIMARTLSMLREAIPPETTLLCGHGPVSTMERELATNPYLR